MLAVKENDQHKDKIALVLGEDSRSFLTVIRSLGKAGFEVHVVCYDRKSIALKSKYISEKFYYNYQACSLQEWTSNIRCLIERYEYDLIFPCDERAIYPLLNLKQTISNKTKLAIANLSALECLFDKWQTKQLALTHQIPVAKGRLIKLYSTIYSKLCREFSLPFVIKPLQSFDAEALDKRNKVVIIRNEKDFTSFIAEHSQENDYLIEEYFAGNGEGLAILAWQGEIKAALAYKRLAEPHFGGGSSYRESIAIDELQLDATKIFCEKLEFSGIAMFEFRRNPDTLEWILVEVNARAWGGMPLADYAGVDFPKLYVEQLCQLSAQQQSVILKYKRVRARALLTDLYEIKRECEFKQNRVAASAHFCKRIINILQCVTPKESIDTLRYDDIKPFLAEIYLIFRDIFFSARINKNVVNFYRKKQIQKQIRKCLSFSKNRRVLFLCYGNIMRSPFAEQYYIKQTRNVKERMPVTSFGFHKTQARQSPDIAQLAAKHFECELIEHRSKYLSQQEINETDLIFYFDNKNKNLLESFYRTNHAFCLANLLSGDYANRDEIEDPYNSDIDKVKLCYLQITQAIDNFIAISKEVSNVKA